MKYINNNNYVCSDKEDKVLKIVITGTVKGGLTLAEIAKQNADSASIVTERCLNVLISLEKVVLSNSKYSIKVNEQFDEKLVAFLSDENSLQLFIDEISNEVEQGKKPTRLKYLKDRIKLFSDENVVQILKYNLISTNDLRKIFELVWPKCDFDKHVVKLKKTFNF